MCLCAPTTLSTQKVKEALGTCTVLSKGTFFLLSYLTFSGVIICAFQYVAPTRIVLECLHLDVFIRMLSLGFYHLDAFFRMPFSGYLFKEATSRCSPRDAYFGVLSLGCYL